MMKKLLFLCFLGFAAAGLHAQNPVTLKNEVDSASYAFGQLIGSNLMQQMPAELNVDLLLKALGSTLKSEAQPFELETANQVFVAYNEKAQAAMSEKSKAAGRKFLETNKTRAGVQVTPSGLQYEVLKRGTGTVFPAATSQVKVHYHGTVIDGTVFDSSVERGEPITFGLDQVIPGWTEGVQLMHVGDKFKFFIPSELAYGESSPTPVITPHSTLIFEVELLEIMP